MAEPSDLTGEVVALYDPDLPKKKRDKAAESMRRTTAVTMVQAGFSYEAISERLNITVSGARQLVQRALTDAEGRAVEAMRQEENSRLDRMQMAVWGRAIQGEIKAIDAVLRIQQRRARLNGLDEPTKLDVNLHVRQEMETALAGLEALVLEGEIISESIHDADTG